MGAMRGAHDNTPPASVVPHRSRLAWTVALGLAACAAACTGQLVHGSSADHGMTEDDAGATPFAGGDGAAATPLGLTVSPAAPAVCPGQCVDLVPQAGGGVAPYTYRWADGAASGAGTRHVCPGATTTYTAIGTDSSGSGGELARQGAQALASVTVTVGACVDGGLEGGAPDPDPLPTTGLRPVCTASWPTVASGLSGPAIRDDDATVAVDPAGNIVAATSFANTFAIGGRTLQAANEDAMVIKLDANCNVVWTRQFGAAQAFVNVIAIATDAASNILLAGNFSTDEGPSFLYGVDFGTGPQSSGHTAAYVVKLDPTGKTLWARTFAPPDTDGHYNLIDDLATDPAGDALFVFRGVADLGPGAQLDAGTDGVFLVKLDPQGNTVFGRSSGSLVSASWAMDSVSAASDSSIWVAGADLPGHARVVHLAPDATVLSTQVAVMPTSMPWNGSVAVRVGPNDDVVLSASSGPGQTAIDWDRWLEGLSPTGAVRWIYPDLAIPGSFIDPAELVRVDASGNAWLAGQFTGTFALGGPAGTLTTQGTTWSADVAILGTDGKFASGGVGPAMADPVVGDMALSADGRSVVVTGWNSGSGFFVSKLSF
jgi:hypothetical protein